MCVSCLPASPALRKVRGPFSEFASGVGYHQWTLFDVAISSNIDLFRIYPVAPVVSLSDPTGFSCLFEALQKTWRASSEASPLRGVQASALVTLLCNNVLVSWQQAGYGQTPGRYRQYAQDTQKSYIPSV